MSVYSLFSHTHPNPCLGLGDVAVSRLRQKLSWGIPVPDDPDHVVRHAATSRGLRVGSYEYSTDVICVILCLLDLQFTHCVHTHIPARLVFRMQTSAHCDPDAPSGLCVV